MCAVFKNVTCSFLFKSTMLSLVRIVLRMNRQAIVCITNDIGFMGSVGLQGKTIYYMPFAITIIVVSNFYLLFFLSVFYHLIPPAILPPPPSLTVVCTTLRFYSILFRWRVFDMGNRKNNGFQLFLSSQFDIYVIYFFSSRNSMSILTKWHETRGWNKLQNIEFRLFLSRSITSSSWCCCDGPKWIAHT